MGRLFYAVLPGSFDGLPDGHFDRLSTALDTRASRAHSTDGIAEPTRVSRWFRDGGAAHRLLNRRDFRLRPTVAS